MALSSRRTLRTLRFFSLRALRLKEIAKYKSKVNCQSTTFFKSELESQIQNKANFHRNIILEFFQLIRPITIKTT